MKRTIELCIIGVCLTVVAAYGEDVQQVVQYQTSFERSPSADGWNVRQGNWTHDAVTGTFTSPGTGGQLCTYEGPLAYGRASTELRDYTIIAELEPQGANFAGLAGRVRNNSNLYNLRYNRQAGAEALELYRIGGPTLLLDSAPLALADLPGRYTLSLEMAGNSLVGKLLDNGVELAIVSAEDDVHSSGPGGLRNSFSGGSVAYHSFLLTEPLYTTSRNVSPPDGGAIEETWTELQWLPGAFSLSSSVYMGTDFNDVNESAAGTFLVNTVDISLTVGLPGFPFPDGLEPGMTYYWRANEVNESDPNSPWKGDVWSFLVYPDTAYHPIPSDGMKFVDPNADLNWDASRDIDSFNVYFGTDRNQVAQGSNSPAIVEATNTSFDPGPLKLDTTYYWRVDVVRLNGQTTTGEVWSFTTAREGGGLIGSYHVWQGGSLPNPPASAFTGRLCMTRIDPTIDFYWGVDSPDANLIRADYFAVAWTGELDVPFSDTYTFYAAADDGVILWVNDQEVIHSWRDSFGHEQRGQIDLVGGEKVPVQMWLYAAAGDATARLLWESDRMATKQVIPAAALYPPVQASSSEPSNGAVDVVQTTKLHWYAGRKAAQHDVYFSEDAGAVANADNASVGVYAGRQSLDVVTFDPGPLEWGKTYYWRVDEVNSDDSESPWKGDVWSFTTADFLLIDDFESYTNNDAADEAVWQTWIDGLDVAENGSQVGYLLPPYCEWTIVHGGLQSMPLLYSNISGATYSEVKRTFATAQDWTESGVQTLGLWFRGDPNNTTGQLYMKIDGVKVPYAGDLTDLTLAAWQPWNIDLTTVSGVDLKSVTTLTIGIEGNAAVGTLYVDDIRAIKP